MGERKVFGMKIKAVRMESVEIIAYYWHTQAVAVGTMYTQLVGAARMGREQYAVIWSFLSNKFIFGHRRFPIFVVNNLTGTIQIVGGER